MVTLRADITSLERQRGFLHRLQELRTEIRTLGEERGHLQTQIEADVEKQNSDQEKRAVFLSLQRLRVFLAWRLSQSISALNRLCHSDRRRIARGLACHKKLSPLFQRLLALVKVGMLVVNALHARQLVVQAHL